MNETAEVVSVKKKKMNKTPLIIGAGVVVVLAVLVAVGLVYVGVKLPYQKAVVRASVCDTEQALNTINPYFVSSVDSSAAKYREAISKITSYQRYAEDATCTSALVRLYFLTGNPSDMEAMLNKTKELASKGIYPSNKLNVSLSVSEAEQDLMVIKE